MNEYPENLIEFREWFATEQACRDYIVRLRWPHGFKCPSCQGEKVWKMGSMAESVGKKRQNTIRLRPQSGAS